MLDWGRLRPAPAGWSSFEELCCQLAARERMPKGSKFTRLNSPDGGVECFWSLPDGTEAGWQAKFFVKGVKSAQKRQIAESIARARRTHPNMTRYVVCLPANRRHRDGGQGPEFVDKWAVWAGEWKTETGMDVEFWGSAEIEERLGRVEHAGRRRYFFDGAYLDDDWFAARLSAAVERAKLRYAPETNVDLPISFAFECLCRTPKFHEALRIVARRISTHHRRASTRDVREHAAADLDCLGREIDAITAAMDAGGSLLSSIDYLAIAESAGKAQELALKITSTLAAREREAAGGGPADPYRPRPFASEAHHLDELSFLLADLGRRIKSGEYASANTKALVVRGDAGAGKTHLFCHVAERRGRAGLPTILLYGSDFEGGDPLPRIKEKLDLDTTMAEFLSALNAAGEASGSRALVLVDALNEGGGPSVWREHLAEVLDLASRYPWVAVALSVRTTYEKLTIPEHIVPGKAASITHAGFGNMTDRAMRVFFDGNGIERPGMPMLAPELSNPLFLTILCRGLKNRGMTRVPGGKFTLMSVYNLYIDSVNEKISGPDRLDRPPEARLVDSAIGAIASLMISAGSWRVDYMDAYEKLGEIHPESRESRSLLSLLIREGVLSEDYDDMEDRPRRVVGFAYERMAENLLVRSILRGSALDDLPRMFGDGGELAKCLKTMGSYRGIIDALSIQIPEKFNKELIEVIPAGAGGSMLYESFLASLAWRSPSSVGARAADLADKCLKLDDGPHAAFGPLLSVSATPCHRLNAEYLDARLKPLTMADRDRRWSIFLDADYHEEDSVVRRLIAWGRDADKSAAPPEAIELAGVTLAWFLTCHNRLVRDRATKALVSLLLDHTNVLVRILDRFSKCNDPYVMERLYCVAYGCAVCTRLPSDLERLASHTYKAVFKGGDPPADIMLREYARLIIDEALDRGCRLGVDLDKCTPPHSSKWIKEFPSAAQLAKLKRKNTSAVSPGDGGSKLFASLGEHGDFYTYIINKGMGASGWSDVPLLPGRLPRQAALSTLNQSMTPSQKPHWANLLRLLHLKAGLVDEATPEPDGQAAPRGSDLEAALKFQAKRLHGLLSPDQRDMLDGALSWFKPPWRTGRPIDSRHDPRDIARWVAMRVLEIGWRLDLFGEYDGTISRHLKSPFGMGRERVGKKYQWIAYHELLARLCDNYEFIGESPRRGFAAYHSSRQLLHCRDIDPLPLLSGPFPCTNDRGEQDASFIAYRHDWADHLDDAEWTRSRANLPDIEKMVAVAGSDGTEWLVLGTFFNLDRKIPYDQEIRTTPYRAFDFYMDSFLVKSADASVLAEWWSMPGSRKGAVYDDAPDWPTFTGEMYSQGGSRAPAGAPDFPWREIDVGPERNRVLACPNVHVMHSRFGDSDYSTTATFDLSVPSRPLVVGMRLRYDGRGAFFDESGEAVARDPRAAECGPTALLFRKDVMCRFLRANGYGIVWRADAHKRVVCEDLLSDDNWGGDLAMHASCSLVNGEMASKVNIVDSDSGSREE